MSGFELSEDGKVALADARSRVAAFNEAVAADSLRPAHVPFLYVEQLIAELDRACKMLAPKQGKPVHWLYGERGLTCAGELMIGTVVADSLDEVTCMMCLRALAQRTLAPPAAFIAARDSEIASLREALSRESERADKAEAAQAVEVPTVLAMKTLEEAERECRLGVGAASQVACVQWLRHLWPKPAPKQRTAEEIISFLRQEVSGRAGVSQALDQLAAVIAAHEASK